MESSWRSRWPGAWVCSTTLCTSGLLWVNHAIRARKSASLASTAGSSTVTAKSGTRPTIERTRSGMSVPRRPWMAS